ncbi:MAG: PQQ-binding-like beta-propeller repeat protein [Ktedonobacteraceae bacterium]
MHEIRFRPKAATQSFCRRWKGTALTVVGLAVILVGVFITFPRQQSADAGGTGDWPTYMFNTGRSGYNKGETIINRNSAPNLKVRWTASAGGTIFSQPVTANGVVYWGSYDGYEHATNLNGQQLWATNLGHQSTCTPVNPLGVVSTATVLNGVVYVGGGDDNLYALNASSGSVIWHTRIGDPSTNTFIWDSPLVYNGNVYIGAATIGEATGCKLVPGVFEQLNASNGAILHTFSPVASGCTGAGIWSSPTFDTSDGSVYLSTGTEGHCVKGEAIGIVKLKLTTLAYKSSWVIPHTDRVHDSDFGATPTLFVAMINGTAHKMVGLPNKNGVFYAFDRTTLSTGPLWTSTIAIGGACPQCGQGSISSSVFDGSRLYVAGGKTTINGTNCKGSLRALNPADGSFLWQTCLSGTVMGAVTLAAGVLAVVDGKALTLVNSSSGAILYNNKDNFYGSPSISNGVLYVGSSIDKLYAFGA